MRCINFKLCLFHSISFLKQVKDTMHKAFWEILREHLNSDPPEYSQAMTLLTEIREVCLIIILVTVNPLFY